jgi:DNA-directed RNA polymerase beta subunit
MEVWALEGFGVAHILQEILTYKSDHLIACQEILNATIWGKRIPNHEDPPECFRVLVRELRSLFWILHEIQLVVSGSLSETFMISCLLLTATLEKES